MRVPKQSIRKRNETHCNFALSKSFTVVYRIMYFFNISSFPVPLFQGMLLFDFLSINSDCCFTFRWQIRNLSSVWQLISGTSLSSLMTFICCFHSCFLSSTQLWMLFFFAHCWDNPTIALLEIPCYVVLLFCKKCEVISTDRSYFQQIIRASSA